MKGLIFKHYLKRSLTEPIGIAVVTGLPTVLITILTLVMMGQTPEGVPYMLNGYNMIATHIAIMFMVSFQFFGGNILLDFIHQDFRGDRRWRMFAMPVKDNDYVLGTLAACVLYCIVQGGLVISITAIFLDVYWGNPFILIATLIACACIAQLIWMLLFMIFPKKGTVEAAGQIVTWTMMIASGWIGMNVNEGNVTVTGGGAIDNFITRYGTPISLARNAITDSGFVGDNMNHALFNLGILYALLLVLAIIVTALVNKRGFSPGKNAIAATAVSTPDKKLRRTRANEAPKTHDTPSISPQSELKLIAPTTRGGQLTVYKYALLRAMRSPFSLVLNAVLPLALILMPGLWQGDEPLGFSFIGVALMYGSFVAARGILNDRLEGTITRILTTPTSSFRYLLQNLLAAMTPLTGQILLIGILGNILHEWEIRFTLSIMLIYFLFAVASVAFSFAWSCLFKDKETSYAIFSVLMSVVAMLGGFFIPLSIMPNALRFIGALFPAFWTSNGLLYLRGGNAMGTYWISALVIFMFSVLYMIFGTKRRMV
jgi:ABC-2 type transport system permease protein